MKNLFTDGFFKFLLFFSIIIGISFSILIFLGAQNEQREDNISEPESQLAQ